MPSASHRSGPILVALLLVGLSVEPSRLGIASSGGIDVARWLFLTPLYVLSLIAIARHRRFAELLSGPFGLAGLAAFVTLVVAPYGGSPFGDVVLGLGFVVVGGVAGVATRRLGFIALLRLFGAVTFVLSAASLLDGTLADNGRIAGLYPAANAFGIHGAVLVVEGFRRWLAAPANRRTGHRVPPLVPFAFIALGSVVLVASDSRMSMAAAVVGALVLVRRSLPRPLVIGVVSATVALVFAALSTDLAADLGRGASRTGELEEITTVTGRTDVWDRTVSRVFERPITGHGFNGAVDVYTAEFEQGRIGFDAGEAHNVVLQIAMNGGLIPAVLFLGALAFYVAATRRRPDVVRDGFVAVIMIHGLTESVVREPKDLWFMLMAAFAALASDTVRTAPSTDQRWSRPAPSRTADPTRV